MRGATRVQVVGLLAIAGSLAGGAVGFVAGLLPVPSLGAAAVAIALAAAALDAANVPVLSVRRQVPQYWGRIFDPRLVAVLYGARLGVGPLTLLPTWLWWAAMVLATALEPWAGALTGVTFAIARTVTMTVVATRARSLDRLDRAVRMTAAVVIAASVLAACSGDDDDATEETTPTLELVPSTTTTTTEEDEALEELLIDESLPGFVLNEGARATGVLDLDAAAAAEVDVEAERALLETRGFVRGAARAWIGPEDDVVYVAAYELGSRRQADAYLVDGAETLGARGATAFDVADVPGAVGFTTREEGFVAHAVAFTRAERWFLVLVGSSTGARTSEEAVELAARQAARAG